MALKIFLIIPVALFLFSCEKDRFEPEITQRAIFMYFPWSTDLLGYFQVNIADMGKSHKNKRHGWNKSDCVPFDKSFRGTNV